MRYAAAIIAAIMVAAAAQAATVRLSDTASVDHNVVTLSDVASIESGTAAERERLAKVSVGYIREGQSAAALSAESVRQALLDGGINLSAVTISGAKAVKVTRGAQAVSRVAWAAGAVETYLKGVEPETHFRVSDVRVEGVDGVMSPIVTGSSAKALRGVVCFDVADASRPSDTVGRVYAGLARTLPVVTARRRIPSGTNVSPADVEAKYVPEEEAAGCATSMADVLGHRMLYTIEAGRPLLESYLQSEQTVKRGDGVLLVLSSGRMEITVTTIALQGAGVGDVARLRREGDKREYLGRITGPGRAVPATGGQE